MTTIQCKNCQRRVMTVLGHCPLCAKQIRINDPRPLLLALVAVLMAYYINSQSVV